MAPNDTSPEAYAEKLKLWLLFTAAVVALGVINALVQRYVGPLPQPLPPVPVVVVTPDGPGAQPFKVNVIHPNP